MHGVHPSSSTGSMRCYRCSEVSTTNRGSCEGDLPEMETVASSFNPDQRSEIFDGDSGVLSGGECAHRDSPCCRLLSHGDKALGSQTVRVAEDPLRTRGERDGSRGGRLREEKLLPELRLIGSGSRAFSVRPRTSCEGERDSCPLLTFIFLLSSTRSTDLPASRSLAATRHACGRADSSTHSTTSSTSGTSCGTSPLSASSSMMTASPKPNPAAGMSSPPKVLRAQSSSPHRHGYRHLDIW